METFENRLKRFTVQSEREIPLTLLNSIDNYFLPEIRTAREGGFYYLLWLGIHAIIQTISEMIFSKTSLEGTRFYLEKFVDGPTTDTKFSLIAEQVHELRNIIAHRWLSSLSHFLVIDNRIQEGWRQNGMEITINPTIFVDQFLSGFGADGRIWGWQEHVSKMDLTIRKYNYIKRWLALDKENQISVAIRKLADCKTLQEVRGQEPAIKKLIFREYKLT